MALVPKPASLIEVEGSGVVTIGADGMTGRRIGRCLSTEMAQAVGYIFGAITKTSDNERYTEAQAYPGFPSLKAMAITCSPWGRTGNSSWESAVLPSQYQKLEIEYKTVDYQVPGQEKENPENEEYMIQDVNYTCETIIVPVKVTDTNHSSATSTRLVSQYIRLPKIEYKVTIPKVKFPKFSIIQELSGKVNTVPVFGGAFGTVLFDGPKLSNTISSLGDPAWKQEMTFIYNRFGWNKTLHPETLKWVSALSPDGGVNLMYEQADLSRLWRRSAT